MRATGLTAETVIGALEDADDYAAFEMAVTSDYDARTAVERELVPRLASLPWRLRRANKIESGLFKIPAEHLREYRRTRQGYKKIVDNLYRLVVAHHGNERPREGRRSIKADSVHIEA
jgi:hypothetical protein